MAELIKNKLTHWIKDHAGFWTFGIFVVAILGLLGGIGVWALDSQDRKIMATLTAEAKRLDTRIDGNTELLKLIDKKIDRVDQKIDGLGARVDKKIDNMDKKIDDLSARMDKKIDDLSARMDRKIDNLSARMNQKIDSLSSRMDKKIDNLSARMDTILDRLPAR